MRAPNSTDARRESERCGDRLGEFWTGGEFEDGAQIQKRTRAGLHISETECFIHAVEDLTTIIVIEIDVTMILPREGRGESECIL